MLTGECYYSVQVFHCLIELTSTHLLSNHDDTTSLCRPAKSRNGKDLNKAREHVAGLCQSLLFKQRILIDQLGVDEIQISRSLKRAVS